MTSAVFAASAATFSSRVCFRVALRLRRLRSRHRARPGWRSRRRDLEQRRQIRRPARAASTRRRIAAGSLTPVQARCTGAESHLQAAEDLFILGQSWFEVPTAAGSMYLSRWNTVAQVSVGTSPSQSALNSGTSSYRQKRVAARFISSASSTS